MPRRAVLGSQKFHYGLIAKSRVPRGKLGVGCAFRSWAGRRCIPVACHRAWAFERQHSLARCRPRVLFPFAARNTTLPRHPNVAAPRCSRCCRKLFRPRKSSTLAGASDSIFRRDLLFRHRRLHCGALLIFCSHRRLVAARPTEPANERCQLNFRTLNHAVIAGCMTQPDSRVPGTSFMVDSGKQAGRAEAVRSGARRPAPGFRRTAATANIPALEKPLGVGGPVSSGSQLKRGLIYLINRYILESRIFGFAGWRCARRFALRGGRWHRPRS